MRSDAVVGVIGATGALGKEVLAVLDAARWRPATVRAYASLRSAIPFVDYGDEQLPVDEPGNADWDELDLVILATPRSEARALAQRAVGNGVLVVDASAEMASDADVPLVVPWVNPEVLAEPSPRGVLATPGPTGTLLASILGPLERAGMGGPTSATALVPASVAGRDGIDELSRQVVALFNTGTAPRKVFRDGLAFDLLPLLGTERDGWTDREREASAEVERLVGRGVDVTMVGVPLFSGISANIRIEPTRTAPHDLVLKVLADGGVKLPEGRDVPRPRKVEGKPFAHVARVREGGDGALYLWASMDNLRTGATVAVSAAAALLMPRKPS